ncbi:hypothetical protein ACOMHN_063599 [Nucella lapillus]
MGSDWELPVKSTAHCVDSSSRRQLNRVDSSLRRQLIHILGSAYYESLITTTQTETERLFCRLVQITEEET